MEWIGKYVSIATQLDGNVYHYKGIVKSEDEFGIFLDDRYKGMIFLSHKVIVRIEEVGNHGND